MGGKCIDGGLGKLLGIAYGLFGALAVGDVRTDAAVSQVLAIGCYSRLRVGGEPPPFAVGASHTDFRSESDTLFYRPAKVREVGWSILRVN
jgi:hypothetical protein